MQHSTGLCREAASDWIEIIAGVVPDNAGSPAQDRTVPITTNPATGGRVDLSV